MFRPIPNRWTPIVLSVLRIVAGFLFAAHGSQKLFGMPAPAPGGPAEVASLMGVAGILELAGGVLLCVGLWTRPVAFVLSGEMAYAYFSVHAPNDFWPLLNGGELAALYGFLFLYLAAARPGPWSLDATRGDTRVTPR